MMAPAMSRMSPKTNSPAAAIMVLAAMGSPHLRGGGARPASHAGRSPARAEDRSEVGAPNRVPQEVREKGLDTGEPEARPGRPHRAPVARQEWADQEGHPQRGR